MKQLAIIISLFLISFNSILAEENTSQTETFPPGKSSQNQGEKKKAPPSASILTTNNKKSPSFFKHNVGIAGGGITGYGLSYRGWYSNNNGFQISFLPMGKYNSNKSNNYINVSVGFVGLRSLYRGHMEKFGNFKNINGNLFFYYGGNYYGAYEEGNSLNESRNFSLNSEDNDYTYNFDSYDELQRHALTMGGGAGAELSFWRITFSLMIGYGVTGEKIWLDDYQDTNWNQRYSNERRRGKNPDEKWSDIFEAAPSVEAALYLSFGNIF